jgi:3-hydroxybutyryl-CoA dehydrogenase
MLGDCDFIIEAAVEDLSKKKELFRTLEKITADGVILTTNTSSLSITAISAALEKNRHRVAGMHFFNPANIMKLVEVVKGEFTSNEVMNTVVELSKVLGKEPVVLQGHPAHCQRSCRAFTAGTEDASRIGIVNKIDEIMKRGAL